MEVADDLKKHLQDKLGKIVFLAKHVHDRLNEESLSEHDKKTYLSCLENYTTDLFEAWDYNSILTDEMKERSVRLRAANDKIRDLESQLGQKVSNSDVVMGAARIQEEIDSWWKEQGFSNFHRISIDGRKYVTVKLAIDPYMRNSYTFRDNSLEEQKRLQRLDDENLSRLKEIYEICGSKELKDTDGNRKKIISLILGEFPDAILQEFEIRKSMRSSSDTKKDFRIASITFHIGFDNIQLPSFR